MVRATLGQTDSLDVVRSSIDRATELVAAELGKLIKEGAESGQWSDERGTADGLIAVAECLPLTAYPRLRGAAAEWLVQKRIEERSVSGPGACSWQEEIWDTSVTLIALSAQKDRYFSVLAAGKETLHRSFQLQHSNWNDEPWETTWALLAWDRLRRVEATSSPPDVPAALTWLLRFVGSPFSGLLINAHYTALFLLVVKAYANQSALGLDHEELICALLEARERCTEGLNDRLEEAGDDTLWTSELWSNSLVLWALADCERLTASASNLDNVLNRFERFMKRDKPAPPTEDRAFACVALFKLIVFLTDVERTTLAKAEAVAAGPHLRSTFEAAVNVLKAQGTEAGLQAEVAKALRHVDDFCPHVPPVSWEEHFGYYTVNVSQKWTHVAGAALLTVAGTVLSQLFPGGFRGYLAWGASGVGVLVGLATMFGFSVLDPLRRSVRRTDKRES